VVGIVVAVVAALVLTVVASAQATPEPPEYGKCLNRTEAKEIGLHVSRKAHYKDAACTEESFKIKGKKTPKKVYTGSYEWFPTSSGEPYEGSLGAVTVESTAATLACSGSTLTGELTSPKTKSMNIVLSGCKLTVGLLVSEPCENVSPETILFLTLTGQIATVGSEVDLTVGTAGADDASFSCGKFGEVSIKGSAIAKVSGNIDEMSETETLKFAKEGTVELEVEKQASSATLSAEGTTTNDERTVTKGKTSSKKPVKNEINTVV
jgi:hypothetical protein